jgi:hypothetical protein
MKAMQDEANAAQGFADATEEDYAEAARLANVAITDMADNANKYGTQMESLQYAYQGFAKQNFTMLDNLKLGRQSHIAQYKPCENGETLRVAA